MQQVKTLMDLAMTEKWTLFCGSVLLLISSMITMALPFGLGEIVDLIFKPDGAFHARENLTNICVAILGVALIQALCTFGRAYLMEVASDRITNKMRTEVFSSIFKQEIGFFDKNRTGELINRLSSDTSQMSFCVTGNISKGLKSVFQATVGITMMTYQSSALSYISLRIIPVFAFISIIAGYYLKNLRKELQDELAIATQIAEEKISNIRTVRAFCQEALEAKTYQSRLSDVLKLGSEEAWIHSILAGMAELGNAVIIVVVLYYGGDMVLNNSMTVGTLSAFSLYVIYVGNALNGMSSFYTEMMKGQGASIRLWELINRTPSIPLTEGDIPSESIAGTIRIHNVSFFYPTRPDVLVLDNATLDIPAGSTLAIVGPSGTGKTTLVSLILRFYNPTSGVIKLDGVDISRLSPEWLRQQIGLVSQEPVLFSGSIKDNILYGIRNPEEVDEKRLLQVAEESNAFEFIRRFADNFDTIVGDRGVMLSGGQKQRIAIARALIKNPKILIFDEATSSLDAENEYLVQKALERVAKNRTVIIIAHRLSTIKNADKIAVVSDGQCAEVGDYEDLMKIPYGKFRKLVERQAINVNPPSKSESL